MDGSGDGKLLEQQGWEIHGGAVSLTEVCTSQGHLQASQFRHLPPPVSEADLAQDDASEEFSDFGVGSQRQWICMTLARPFNDGNAIGEGGRDSLKRSKIRWQHIQRQRGDEPPSNRLSGDGRKPLSSAI